MKYDVIWRRVIKKKTSHIQENTGDTHQQLQPCEVVFSSASRLIDPGIRVSLTPPLLLVFWVVLAWLVEVAQSSGVSRIFSTTSSKVSRTPTDVFAEASMNSEFMRSANRLPSDAGT